MSKVQEIRATPSTRLSDGEELANVITHGLGLALSLAGAAILAVCATQQRDPWRIAALLAYATSLVGLYAMSTLSHYFTHPQSRSRFRSLDQGFIYLLIVATYTPFSVAYLTHGGWWLFLGAMWTAALAGFCSKVFFTHRLEMVSVWLYVVLGWMPVLTIFAYIGVAPSAMLWWVLIGGVFYTVGTLFLALDRHVPYFHAVWHLFVIAGSASHFFAIFQFVARTL